MGQSIDVVEFIDRVPPLYRARWRGKKLTITLDSSAMLKLADTLGGIPRPSVFASKIGAIETAAQRLLETKASQPIGNELTVTLSALDLD